MELHLVSVLLLVLVCYGNNLVQSGLARESPRFTVVHSESDFEIRIYEESWWVSALVQGGSFRNSTNAGFHRIYQYIHGGNSNSSRYEMTAPVITSIHSPLTDDTVYYVKVYLPTKSPPQPNAELNLQIDEWRSHCVAVRKFSGFAQDDNINKEAEALVNSLNKYFNGKAILEDEASYTIAQYNSTHQLTGRLNEVWMNISAQQRDVRPIKGNTNVDIL